MKKKSYGTPSRPAQLKNVTFPGRYQAIVIGVFYNAPYHHLCEYEPYCCPPESSLCGRHYHWAASRDIDKLCPDCEKIAKEKLKKKVLNYV